jgi:hypothetical protein
MASQVSPVAPVSGSVSGCAGGEPVGPGLPGGPPVGQTCGSKVMPTDLLTNPDISNRRMLALECTVGETANMVAVATRLFELVLVRPV